MCTVPSENRGSDTGGGGSSFPPLGSIAFTADAGTLTAGSCSFSTPSGQFAYTCTATYTATVSGSHSVTATYTPSDNSHSGSSGRASITVQ